MEGRGDGDLSIATGTDLRLLAHVLTPFSMMDGYSATGELSCAGDELPNGFLDRT
jgi:hypothetical protein